MHACDRRRALLQCGATLALGAGGRLARAGRQPRVVFLNPGEQQERNSGPLWPLMARSMQDAAQGLGIELEVLYGERDPKLLQRNAAALAARARQPDYIVLVNEQLAGEGLLERFAPLPARLVLVHADLTAEQRARTGNERGRIGNWIGTFLQDNERAAHRVVAELLRSVEPEPPRVLAIAGDPLTPVSLERTRGLQSCLDKGRRGELLALVNSDWSRGGGEARARELLARHPEANVIWAANDSMALGALEAARQLGRRPRVGGMGGWTEALQSIAGGGMTATAEGYLLIGGLALLRIHEHFHGRDFVDEGGPRLMFDYLNVVTRERFGEARRVVYGGAQPLNWRAASRVYNPAVGPRSMRLKELTSS
ncbi:ABC transporter substrate-binding protein [Pelomonas sp. KK5]|uniref:ABC transporter substrate-binding protein n=1 Tax=Pelomonas sp. KK5 TaxID=1855730 RepID=UPI00097BDC72|nr:ABC transporter substrate-binding protein [Pelomonas sp. KK5]